MHKAGALNGAAFPAIVGDLPGAVCMHMLTCGSLGAVHLCQGQQGLCCTAQSRHMGGRCCQGLPVALKAGRGTAQGEQDGARLDQAEQAGRIQVDGSPVCLHQPAVSSVASNRAKTGLNMRSEGSWAGGTTAVADHSHCDTLGVLCGCHCPARASPPGAALHHPVLLNLVTCIVDAPVDASSVTQQHLPNSSMHLCTHLEGCCQPPQGLVAQPQPLPGSCMPHIPAQGCLEGCHRLLRLPQLQVLEAQAPPGPGGMGGPGRQLQAQGVGHTAAAGGCQHGTQRLACRSGAVHWCSAEHGTLDGHGRLLHGDEHLCQCGACSESAAMRVLTLYECRGMIVNGRLLHTGSCASHRHEDVTTGHKVLLEARQQSCRVRSIHLLHQKEDWTAACLRCDMLRCTYLLQPH